MTNLYIYNKPFHVAFFFEIVYFSEEVFTTKTLEMRVDIGLLMKNGEICIWPSLISFC